jgi:outer membrane receptor for ferrienterochelin and colicins
MFKSRVILLSFLAAALAGVAQSTDSLISKDLETIVVTATRNERQMGALPMPVTLIPKVNIQTMGSVRLTDVLTEQTGLVVVPQVNGQGNGLQLQGFNPDYTLILIDGEPFVGRTTGTLELSRISVGNIKQIEIVKGPSSSLYGSEALAGVINIITERPAGTKVGLYSRYGSNNTLDLNADVSLSNDKVGFYAFANRYSTNGYDLSPNSYGKTVSPFHNYTLSSKLTFKLSSKTQFNISGRWFDETQVNRFRVISGNEEFLTAGQALVSDWNLNPVLTHRFSNHVKSTLRLYATRYNTATNLNREPANTPYYYDAFDQFFLRPEFNSEIYFNEKHVSSVGAGYIHERVSTTRYNDDKEREQQTRYAFLQHEWQPTEALSLIGGARFDQNSVFGSQLSPKFSTRWVMNSKLTLKGSVGVGFKAPDFRQLYYNFTNSAAGGYSVLGAEVVGELLADLEAQGQIQAYVLNPSEIGKLDAERSTSINLGGTWKLSEPISLDFNFFRNNVNNLIDSRIVAITTSDQNIYSYKNTERAFTQGLELNTGYRFNPNWNFSLGYQLLFAKDRDVVDAIKEGSVYRRDPETLVTYRLKEGEYFGLYNRSRHTGNFKIFYDDKTSGWFGSLRIIYRGRYGAGDMMGNIQGEAIPVSDKNNNSIQDVYDNFVRGYALVNVSIGKNMKAFRLQGGVDNIFNYTEPVFIPNLPGRLAYISVAYTWRKK